MFSMRHEGLSGAAEEEEAWKLLAAHVGPRIVPNPIGSSLRSQFPKTLRKLRHRAPPEGVGCGTPISPLIGPMFIGVYRPCFLMSRTYFGVSGRGWADMAKNRSLAQSTEPVVAVVTSQQGYGPPAGRGCAISSGPPPHAGRRGPRKLALGAASDPDRGRYHPVCPRMGCTAETVLARVWGSRSWRPDSI